jgi:hypothetical protein
VTYLGTGLPIVYHGPGDAAAAMLLRDHAAGELATSPSGAELAATINRAADRGEELAAGALRLGRERFMIEDQRQTFWGGILPLLEAPATTISGAGQGTVSL